MIQMVKNLPAMEEMRVQSLVWEDPLEKEIATHSSILAWKISWMEEPGRLQFTGSQTVGHDWARMHTGKLGCIRWSKKVVSSRGSSMTAILLFSIR